MCGLSKEELEKQKLERYQVWLKNNAAKPNHQGRGTGQGNDWSKSKADREKIRIYF